MYNVVKIFLLIFIIDGAYGNKSTDKNTCSHYFSSVNSSYLLLSNNVTITALKFPVELQFNRPVTDLKGESMDFHRVNSHQWRLTSYYCNVTKCGFEILSDFDDVKITKFSNVICEELREIMFQKKDKPSDKFGLKPRMSSVCNQTGTLAFPKLDPNSVLKRQAKWRTGRNYRIEISSLPTFVGYVLELYFTKPITGISELAEGIKSTKLSNTHWVITKNVTDKACVKLIDVFFQVSYNYESDIESLLLNGEPIVGNKTSKAFLRNRDVSDAMNDCEKYIIERDFWFGVEIGRQSYLEAKIDSDETTIGVVVDFVFEKEIKEFALWELTSEMVSRTHWRMHNQGYVVPPQGLVRFPFKVIYYNHFHVKIKGIKLNGRVLCGLGAPIYYEIEKDLPGGDLQQMETNKKEDLYNRLLWSVILTGAIIVASFGAFCWNLILVVREVRRRRKHLCDYPEREPPKELKETVDENNYGGSIYSTITESSTM